MDVTPRGAWVGVDGGDRSADGGVEVAGEAAQFGRVAGADPLVDQQNTGLTGRLRDHTLKGLANKTLIRNSLTSRTGFHGLK